MDYKLFKSLDSTLDIINYISASRESYSIDLNTF